MHYCKNCAIPGDYPGISIDTTGLCNDCRAFTPGSLKANVKVRASLEKELYQAANILRKKKYKYHCAVALSGDKESSYVTWLLARKYKLNVLAITVDTSLLREQSYKNIFYVTNKLGVDHVFINEHDLFKTAYKYALTHDLFSHPKGSVSFVSSKLISDLILAYARKHNIPWVARGNCDLNAPRLFFGKKFLHPMNTLVDYTQVLEELAVQLGEDSKDRFLSEKTTSLISIVTMYMYQKSRGYNPYLRDACDQLRNGLTDKVNVGAMMNMTNRPAVKELVAYALKLIKEEKLSQAQLKRKLYVPVLDDPKEAKSRKYLQQNAIDLGAVLRQPSLYYPGAGADFAPFEVFTKNSMVSTVIYCDYVCENARRACKEFIYTESKEHEIISFKQIGPKAFGCRSWKDFWPSAPGAYKLGDPADAFGLFVEVRHRPDNKVINFIYLCTEAIQTYKILFSDRKISPAVVVIQDHGISRNWDNFARGDSKLYEIAKPSLPGFLYAAAEPVWPGYERISDYGDEEGSGRNKRALYVHQKESMVYCKRVAPKNKLSVFKGQ